ncbi:MAG TPA: hypothetical protein VD846_03785 [Allosphingosinicella sp.]|nr:hypothetical protein [Allosphingosinicella sp.]
MRSEIKAMLALAGLAAGCADRPAGAADGARGSKETPGMERATSDGDGISGLPSSFGRSFASLDEYLGHLRQNAAPIDLPWYREVRPGVYEYVTTMRPAGPPKTYTREELMREFGFTR